MAKIFSFPDGKIIEDVKQNNSKEQILKYVKSNPDNAAMQILNLSNSNKIAIKTLQKIIKYSSQHDNLWAKQILSIIENNYKIEVLNE